MSEQETALSVVEGCLGQLEKRGPAFGESQGAGSEGQGIFLLSIWWIYDDTIFMKPSKNTVSGLYLVLNKHLCTLLNKIM